MQAAVIVHHEKSTLNKTRIKEFKSRLERLIQIAVEVYKGEANGDRDLILSARKITPHRLDAVGPNWICNTVH